jgi:energy-converting hydrogenase Eha subunit H
MYVGDIIFQLIVIFIPVLLIVFIIAFTRSSKKRKEQLKRIEDKLDKVTEQNQDNNNRTI